MSMFEEGCFPCLQCLDYKDKSKCIECYGLGKVEMDLESKAIKQYLDKRLQHFKTTTGEIISASKLQSANQERKTNVLAMEKSRVVDHQVPINNKSSRFGIIDQM